MANLLDGRVLSEQIMSGLKLRVDALRERGITVGLAVVCVGDDPASRIYIRNKNKACEELGIRNSTLFLPANTSQEELEARLSELNSDPDVDGILLQLPLPEGLDETRALNRIAPEKDADGFHPVNAGLLLAGQTGIRPCTPRGILAMLKSTGLPLAGRRAVVIGRSAIVGKPVALMLLEENCTVTVCHSHTENLADITRQADILVCAVGRPHFVTADMVKPGASVIDVGINRVPGPDGKSRVVGDVDFDAVEPIAGYISPVPGGVGKMTIAMLMSNVTEAAERKASCPGR